MNNKEYWILYRTAFKADEPTKKEMSVIKKLYETEGREKIYEKVKRKKIIPAAAALFKKLGLDVGFWAPISDGFRERNIKVAGRLNDIYSALENTGVGKIVVVENFGALLHAEEDLCMFGSGDVDNYADISEKERIYETLRSEGFDIEEEYAGNILISTAFKNGSDMPENFYFSVNWDMTNRVNLPCLTAKAPFVDWSRTTYYKETRIRLPRAEELMYICLMHIAVHGFCKSPDIRLFYDVVNASKKGINWEEIVSWAKRDSNEVRVAVGMILSKRLLGVDIPENMLCFANEKRINRLLSLVSNKEENSLMDFPKRIRRFLIDVYSCDNGIAEGIKYIFFPDKDWIKDKYGSVFRGRIKHIVDLL